MVSGKCHAVACARKDGRTDGQTDRCSKCQSPPLKTARRTSERNIRTACPAAGDSTPYFIERRRPDVRFYHSSTGLNAITCTMQCTSGGGCRYRPITSANGCTSLAASSLRKKNTASVSLGQIRSPTTAEASDTGKPITKAELFAKCRHFFSLLYCTPLYTVCTTGDD